MTRRDWDVIIVGGGQSGLAVAYYLRRLKIDYLILDAEDKPGGSWQHYWESLKLFSPAQWSSLPGKILQGGTSYYPSKSEVVDYLDQYEEHYDLQIERPVQVINVEKHSGVFHIQTDQGEYTSKAIVGATGSFRNPVTPDISGLSNYQGEVIHSAEYRLPGAFAHKKVGIIGEGNSGAQILAELSKVAETYWLTKNEPDFLPDHVDGKYLFDAATQLYEAKKKGRSYIPPSLGHIVMVPSVMDARERQVLNHYPAIREFTEEGVVLEDNTSLGLDAVIFCTGYLPVLDFLKGLDISFRHNKVDTHGTKSREVKGLWMVGYGSWTGFASATVIGVGRSAKATAEEIKVFLADIKH